MMQKKVYIAPPGTEVSTSVDPMGLAVRIVFDEDGRFATSDPGLTAILDRLAGGRGVIKHEQKKKE